MNKGSRLPHKILECGEQPSDKDTRTLELLQLAGSCGLVIFALHARWRDISNNGKVRKDWAVATSPQGRNHNR